MTVQARYYAKTSIMGTSEQTPLKKQGQERHLGRTAETPINKEGGNAMANKMFLTVEEVAAEMGVSKSYGYRIVKRLNDELAAKNFLTVAGKINKQYFYERTCYGTAENQRK